MASGQYAATGPRGMAGVGKRKEFEEVVDVLADFSLSSSPPLKLRRLDGQVPLPPILEEEIPSPSVMFEQPRVRREQISRDVGMPGVQDMGEAVYLPPCDDKAIVLYRPVDTSTLFSSVPSNASFLVSSELIRGLKNQTFNDGNQRNWAANFRESRNQLAMVPWVPPPARPMSNWSASEPEKEEPEPEPEMPMETEETGVASMEVEESMEQPTSGADALHQWQQQHCMTLQAFPNPFPPVMWSR